MSTGTYAKNNPSYRMDALKAPNRSPVAGLQGTDDMKRTDGALPGPHCFLTDASEAAHMAAELLRTPGMAAHAGLLPFVWAAERNHSPSPLRHLRRVQGMACWLAGLAGCSAGFIEQLAVASVFHDIGWARLNPELASARREPDPHVARQVHSHALIGEQRIRERNGSTMQLAADIARDHHERWDGLGYPWRRAEGDISPGGQIVAIAHFFDDTTDPESLQHPETYPADETIEMIRMAGGYYFNPELARIVHKNRRALMELDTTLMDQTCRPAPRPGIWQALLSSRPARHATAHAMQRRFFRAGPGPCEHLAKL